jgi:cytochrome b
VTGRVRVWDPAVRILHWSLVAAFVLGWATTFVLGESHEAVGWGGAAIVVARVGWGFVGSPRARFATFVKGPRDTLAYLRRVLAGRAPRHVGHNPLGAWMALALLGCVGALALTGWLYRTDRFWGDETVERIHVAVAWSMLALVALHLVGVVTASLRQRENLAAAMLSGTKRAVEEGDIA